MAPQPDQCSLNGLFLLYQCDMYSCVHTCGEQTSLIVSHLIFCDRDSLTLGFLIRLARKDQGSTCVCLPSEGLQTHASMPGILCGCWEATLGPSCLHSSCLSAKSSPQSLAMRFWGDMQTLAITGWISSSLYLSTYRCFYFAAK